MEIVLAISKSEANKADKIFQSDSLTLEGSLRSECSLTDPVIMLEADLKDIVKYNYLQIPDFNRKYFITEMVSVRTHLVRVTAHVDVLSTYIDRLRELPAVLESQESLYNLYLPDTAIKVI